MSRVRLNVFANLASSLCTAALGILMVPVYVRFMGVEAYGLVGLSMSLQIALSVLDLGLGTTVNRELASHEPLGKGLRRIPDLVRTLELVYWGMALAIAIAVVLAAPFIASRWFRPDALPVTEVQLALAAMGVAIAVRFPFALYAGGMQGLQQQVLLNGFVITSTVARSVGAVLILRYVSASVVTFFAWSAATGLLLTLVTAFGLWRSLPSVRPWPKPRLALLRDVRAFAGGMTTIGILAVVLTQSDKLILSRLLPLESYGHYMLAWTIASGLFVLATPVFIAVFPRLTSLAASGDEGALRYLYHLSSQAVAVMVIPVTAVFCVFARECLTLWTGNRDLSAAVAPIAALLALGTGLHAIAQVPYALQLAHGWTRLAIIQNVIAIGLLAPLLVWAASNHGSIGAAGVWFLLTLGYVVGGVQAMHRRLLPQERTRWYARSLVAPIIAVLVAVMPARSLAPSAVGSFPAPWSMVPYLLGVWLLATLACTLVAPELRQHLITLLRKPAVQLPSGVRPRSVP